MDPLLTIAVSAARAAGNFIMRNYERVEQLEVTRKGRSDFATEVDRSAEAEIIRIIRKHHPDHAVLAEESGADGSGEFTWVIDPLDGTTNFLHRLPHFAVSIGLQYRGVLEAGVVYAPCTQDLYTAKRGGGSQLNGRRLRVSKTKNMDEALVGTGVPIRGGVTLDTYMPLLKTIAEKTSGVRRAGSASLDLAYVAAGYLDAFWELNLKPWDIAAGLLLVQESGGLVSEVYGAADMMKTGNVLAANPKLHPQFAELLKTTK
ncbi:MAG: inositol monophosphatase family protein [Pseudomonadota bacterium]